MSKLSVFLFTLVLGVGGVSAACGGADRPTPRGSICTPHHDERKDCRIASEYPDVSDSDLKSVRDEESLRRICQAKCSKVEWLSIEDIGGLENLRALEGVEVEDRLSVSSLPNLRSLEGVTFESTDKISISNNPRLESLKGLESVQRIGTQLSISGNPRLASLDGLENLQVIESRLIIRGDNALENLKGLDGVRLGRAEEISGWLKIESTTKLRSIRGLKSVTTLMNLSISGNGRLQRLNGLGNLKTVGNAFGIDNNPNLPTCLAERLLKQVDFQDDHPDIRENGGYDYEVCEESGSG